MDTNIKSPSAQDDSAFLPMGLFKGYFKSLFYEIKEPGTVECLFEGIEHDSEKKGYTTVTMGSGPLFELVLCSLKEKHKVRILVSDTRGTVESIELY